MKMNVLRIERLMALLLACVLVLGAFAGCVTNSGNDPETNTKATEMTTAEPETADRKTLQLQILATSDMHGKFYPYDYALNTESLSGSCAQLKTAIDTLRTENTILVDGGDAIQDNSADLFLNDDIHPMLLAMNEMGYDVWVLGNHEFNYGIDVLKRIIKQNKANVLCGNVYDQDGAALADDYVIVERSGVKVGIIGMVTSNIIRWDAQNLKDCTIDDAVEETKKVINEIKDKVDVLIAVEHMTIDNEYEEPDTGVEDLANACPELDLIVAAHGHQLIDELTINGVPVVENVNSGATLGQILLDLEKTDEGWSIVKTQTASIDVSAYEADSELLQALKPYHERALEDTTTVIGAFHSDYLAAPNEIAEIPTAQIEDTALIDLINEVQLHYTGAAVSGTALFVTDANLYAGDIRKCDMALIYKYGNTLYKLEMTGAQLKKWMEWSANYYNTFTEGDLTISFNGDIRAYNYDMFSGVNYEINISKNEGSRIENLTWPDGTPVKDDDVFVVAANNYRASSQLTSYGSVFQEGEELPKILEIDVCGDIGGVRALIADYIVREKNGELTASVDHNWKLTGIQWDETLHAKAVELLADGTLTIPCSKDGRTPNVKSITVDDLP